MRRRDDFEVVTGPIRLEGLPSKSTTDNSSLVSFNICTRNDTDSETDNGNAVNEANEFKVNRRDEDATDQDSGSASGVATDENNGAGLPREILLGPRILQPEEEQLCVRIIEK